MTESDMNKLASEIAEFVIGKMYGFYMLPEEKARLAPEIAEILARHIPVEQNETELRKEIARLFAGYESTPATYPEDDHYNVSLFIDALRELLAAQPIAQEKDK